MEFFNPFEEKKDFYKELIDQDSKSAEDAEYVDLTDVDTDQVVNDFMSKNTHNGFQIEALKAIQEARKKVNLRRENQEKIAEMFNKLFDDLNKKYGLQIRFDYNSLSSQVEAIIDPRDKRAYELFLNEAYSRFRVALYAQYLQAIAALSAQILDPAFLLSESMSYDAKLITMEKLFNFMQTMNEIYEQVKIPDSELKLEKLSEDSNQISGININDPEVRSFLESFSKEVKTGKTENKEEVNNE